ncbi:MAG TPA: hypothetical protein VFL92_02350, partial [Sphingomonas sp.]|nr:hypothetical protein [Sphingomonas sp.]
KLLAAQAVGKSGRITAAAGLFDFEADRGDPDRLLLLDDNGSRDYTVLALNGRYVLPLRGKPLAIGADLYRNLRNYRHSADPISRAYADQRTGYVLSASLGDTAKAGHFELGYRYFRMEKLAVDASYAHDDVARFGTPSEASLTDLEGHDLYANYALSRSLTAGFRVMIVHRITNAENGKRARFDIIFSF